MIYEMPVYSVAPMMPISPSDACEACVWHNTAFHNDHRDAAQVLVSKFKAGGFEPIATDTCILVSAMRRNIRQERSTAFPRRGLTARARWTGADMCARNPARTDRGADHAAPGSPLTSHRGLKPEGSNPLALSESRSVGVSEG